MAAYPELRLCISGERLACCTVTKNVSHLAMPPG